MSRRPETQPLQARRSQSARRWLVGSVMLFYLCLLAEGVLRKWLLPGASNALVFLRDPVMVLVLVCYAWSGPSPAMRRMLAGLLAVTLLFVLCAACQAFSTGVSGLVLVVGLRNYLFFVPLSFAIRDGFEPADYLRWVRLNLLLAAPIAVLVAMQYLSPPSAPINWAPGAESEGVFLLVEGVVRPYGLFSFALGHSAFAAWMIGIVLAASTLGRGARVSRSLAVIAAASIAVMGVLSGSRTYFVLAGSSLAVFVAMSLLFGKQRARTVGLVAALGASVAGLAALAAFPSLAANLMDRQATAVASEGSTLDRLLALVTGFLAEADRVPLFGLGLGSGTNVANFLANGRTDHVLAEYELTRVVQELGPLFGLLYIAVRWALLAGFVALAIREIRRGNLQPACFLGFLAPVFLAHDITLQNTMIGIAWFAAGIFLSAVRVGGSLSGTFPQPPHRARPAARGGVL